MSNPPISARRATTLAILEAYETWNVDTILALRTADCVHVISPASLGLPQMNNTTYRRFFVASTARITNFKLKIKDLVEDPVANKVVVHAQSTGDTAAGEDTYGNEYFLLFEFNESGDRITKMVEFVDSAKSNAQAAILIGRPARRIPKRREGL